MSRVWFCVYRAFPCIYVMCAVLSVWCVPICMRYVCQSLFYSRVVTSLFLFKDANFCSISTFYSLKPKKLINHFLFFPLFSVLHYQQLDELSRYDCFLVSFLFMYTFLYIYYTLYHVNIPWTHAHHNHCHNLTTNRLQIQCHG